MADYALQVIQAVIKALKADVAVSALVDKVYSDVPQKTDFPYALVSIQSQPFAADDFSGQQHTLRVQAFSRKASIKECLQIRAAVFNALDRQESSIVLQAGTLIKCEHAEMSDAFIEDDGKTWQSVTEFNIITQ